MKYFFIIIISTLFIYETINADEKGKHLFILSGQSNMAKFKYENTFKPAIVKEFGEENIIVVKSAESGAPIRRWYKDWEISKIKNKKNSKKSKKSDAIGDLYDKMMDAVNKAISGKKIKTITFIWMQGERDAKTGLSDVYEASFLGLIKQLNNDLKRKDINVIIGRLSDSLMRNSHWIKIRDVQVSLAKKRPNTAWINTDDLNDGLNGKGKEVENNLHYIPTGYDILGERYAAEAIELIQKKR